MLNIPTTAPTTNSDTRSPRTKALLYLSGWSKKICTNNFLSETIFQADVRQLAEEQFCFLLPTVHVYIVNGFDYTWKIASRPLKPGKTRITFRGIHIAIRCFIPIEICLWSFSYNIDSKTDTFYQRFNFDLSP